MTSEQPWRGLALPIAGAGTLLNAEASELVLTMARAYARARAVVDGGGGMSPGWQQIVTALEATVAGMADDGHADVRTEPDPATWDTPARADDLVTVKEAARMLKLSERQVRRLAEGGSFGARRRCGRGILVSSAEVRAHRAAHPTNQEQP